MKVGIITYHFAINYGAVLQCLALQNYLEKDGITVQIINYRPSYHTKKYSIIGNPIEMIIKARRNSRGNPILKRIMLIIFTGISWLKSFFTIKVRFIRKKIFNEFVTNNLKLTNKYLTIEELRKNPPDFDVYISGSDQLWNPILTNNDYDPAYFLDFGTSCVKRVTYAISACQMLDIKDCDDKLKALLYKLDNISMRENEYKKILGKLSCKKVDIVIDPTLLLTNDDYSKYEETINIRRKYILIYLFKSDLAKRLTEKIVESYLVKENVAVIDISQARNLWRFKSKKKTCVSPGEFLSYIRYADFIITNSYHCLLFSLIYKKRFVSFPLLGKASRMVELLRNLNLTEHLVQDENIDNILFKDINYEKVDKQIDIMKLHSKQYIRRCVMGGEI